MKFKFLVLCLFMMITNSWALNKSNDSVQFFDAKSQADEFHSAKRSENEDDDLRIAQGDDDDEDENKDNKLVDETELPNSGSSNNLPLTSENLKQLQNELNQLSEEERTTKLNSETASFRTARAASEKDYTSEDYLNEKNIEKKRKEIKALIEKQEEARVKNPEATIKIDRNHVVATNKNDKNLGYRTVSLSEFFSQKPDAKAIMLRMIGRKGYSYKSLINDINEKLNKPNITEDEKELLEKKRIELEQEYKAEEKIIKAHRSLQDDIEQLENKRVAKATKIAIFRNLRMKYGFFKPDQNTKSLSEASNGIADQKALDNRMLGVHTIDTETNDDNEDARSFVSAADKSEKERLQDIQNQRLKVKKISQDIEQLRVSDATPEIEIKPTRHWLNVPGKLKNLIKSGVEKINIISSTELNRNSKISKNKSNFDPSSRSLQEAITGKPDPLAIKNRMLNKYALQDREKLEKLNLTKKNIEDVLNSEEYDIPDQYLSENLRNNKLLLQNELKKIITYKNKIESFLSESQKLNNDVQEFENERVNRNIPTALFRNTRIKYGFFPPKAETKSFSESVSKSNKPDQQAIENHLLGHNDRLFGLKNEKEFQSNVKNNIKTSFVTAEQLEKQRKDVLQKIKDSEQKRLNEFSKSERSLLDVAGKISDSWGKFTKGIVFFRNAQNADGAGHGSDTRSLSEALSGKPDDHAIENVMHGKTLASDVETRKTWNDFDTSVRTFENQRVATSEKTVPFRNWRMKYNILPPDKDTRSFSERYTGKHDDLAYENRIGGISGKVETSKAFEKNAEQVIQEERESKQNELHNASEEPRNVEVE